MLAGLATPVMTRSSCGTMPVPETPMVCGEPPASSTMVTDPLCAPSVAGVKVTEIVQTELTPNAVGQLLVWPKSPLAAIDEMFRAAFPPLVSVTVCAVEVVLWTTLPKLSEVGFSWTSGPLPAPLNVAVCVDALLVTDIDPLRAPATVGLNVTLMLHVALTASVAGQLLVCAKSPVAA